MTNHSKTLAKVRGLTSIGGFVGSHSGALQYQNWKEDVISFFPEIASSYEQLVQDNKKMQEALKKIQRNMFIHDFKNPLKADVDFALSSLSTNYLDD